uniref:Bm10261 n=1 Tax=Brugia malayi TaxID=6279 RepID=A0A1I9GE87_BRUMA|nr:Bm10261 [Brugia malayi]
MSSAWHGCIYEEKLSHRIAPCIADLFYEPSDYDELCFYCVEGSISLSEDCSVFLLITSGKVITENELGTEQSCHDIGACCPHHEVPQPRVRMQHKEGTNPTISVDYVLDEIFGLQSDCCAKYANYQIKIIENCQENVAAKVQQNFAEKRSVCIDQNITRRKKTDIKLITPERHKDRYPTHVLKNSADVASEIMCKDVEVSNKKVRKEVKSMPHAVMHDELAVSMLSRLFRTCAAVQKHQRRQHEVRIRPKCEICQREFPTASLLREHVAVIHLFVSLLTYWEEISRRTSPRHNLGNKIE